MIFCPRCKQQSPDGSPRCVHCGFPDSVAQTTPQANTQPNLMSQSQMSTPPMQAPITPNIPQPPSQISSQSMMVPSTTPQKRGFVESVLGEFAPGVKGNLFFLLALCIPIANILVLIRAGFAKNAPPLKSSFLKAWAIVVGIAIVISIIISVITGIVMASAATRAFDFARYF